MSGVSRVRAAEADAGERLDVVLARRLGEHSRSALGAWIRAGRVAVGGAVARKPAQPVRAGDEIEIDVPPPEPSSFPPEDIPLRVLYEDGDLLVVDKPAGLTVHPAAGRAGGTLVNALLARYRDLAPAADDPRKPGIVHRLDRDTSGCLVVARTVVARRGLEAQFRDRSVSKLYLAVVHGAPAGAGRVDAPIGRHPRERTRMAVGAPRGRDALSEFRVRERFAGAALLEVTIRTGRTHQIRVHLASLGHPVVGDRVYGGRRRSPGPLGAFPRQALHAARLGFAHPRTGAALEFRAPLPIDMEELLAALRARSPADGPAGSRRPGPSDAGVIG